MRIGVWSFAHMHAHSYVAALRERADVEFVGVTDEDAERGAASARRHGVPFMSNPEELLAQTDAIVITSANVDHRDMAERAAAAGASVLLEKPIATTIADAQAIIRAFEHAGVTLGIAFPCPFSPAFVELERVVQTGKLGRILAIKSTNRGSMPGGFFIQIERSGGGAVIDHTVHVADLLRRLTRSEALRVYAEVGRGLYHQAWDDSGLLSIDLADGSFATLDCSWSRPKSYPTWGDVTLHVVAEQGNASADLFGQHVHLYPAEGSKATWQGWGSNLDALMISDFLAAVRDRRPPRSTGLDGLRALEMAIAAYASARAGRPVEVASLR